MNRKFLTRGSFPVQRRSAESPTCSCAGLSTGPGLDATIEETLTKLTELRLTSMARAVRELMQTAYGHQLSFEEKLRSDESILCARGCQQRRE